MGRDAEVVDAERRANHASVLAVPETSSAFGLTAASQPEAITEVCVHFAV